MLFSNNFSNGTKIVRIVVSLLFFHKQVHSFASFTHFKFIGPYPWVLYSGVINHIMVISLFFFSFKLIFFLLYLLIIFFMSLGLHLTYYHVVVSSIPLILLSILPKIGVQDGRLTLNVNLMVFIIYIHLYM